MAKRPLKPVSHVAMRNDASLFNERPIELPGWRLSHRRATPIGKPTIEETQHAMTFADGLHDSSPFWLADIVSYVNENAAWGEKASQVTAATGLKAEHAYNLASMMRKVGQAERDLAPSVEHAKIVSKLEPREQRKWLKQAVEKGWGTRDLSLELNAAQKRGVVHGTADLEGMFRVWLIDFPWIYRQAEPSKVSAQSRYPGMTVEEGIAMGDQIRAHTMKHAVAFWWVTAPMLYYSSDGISPDPFRIITAAGFEPKTGGVWDKVAHNFGHYLSIRHEHLIIATRGDCTPDRPTPMLDSIFSERKTDVHSEKPKTAYKYIERLYDGPYVELFARERRRGWVSWGNQINSKILAKERAG